MWSAVRKPSSWSSFAKNRQLEPGSALSSLSAPVKLSVPCQHGNKWWGWGWWWLADWVVSTPDKILGCNPPTPPKINFDFCSFRLDEIGISSVLELIQSTCLPHPTHPTPKISGHFPTEEILCNILSFLFWVQISPGSTLPIILSGSTN